MGGRPGKDTVKELEKCPGGLLPDYSVACDSEHIGPAGFKAKGAAHSGFQPISHAAKAGFSLHFSSSEYGTPSFPHNHWRYWQSWREERAGGEDGEPLGIVWAWGKDGDSDSKDPGHTVATV